MTVNNFIELVKDMRKAQKKASNAFIYSAEGRRLIKEKELAEDAVDDALAERARRILEEQNKKQMTFNWG